MSGKEYDESKRTHKLENLEIKCKDESKISV